MDKLYKVSRYKDGPLSGFFLFVKDDGLINRSSYMDSQVVFVLCYKLISHLESYYLHAIQDLLNHIKTGKVFCKIDLHCVDSLVHEGHRLWAFGHTNVF